ncbi:hypothetical protein [Actinomadura violacea]|uniref:Transglutaminase-like domain-containing protein n=1 Tax=Actinomadura violacea TaxID=2819934 RepID=A0ABS3S0Z0_9ACTN|nr:hypothetical protein [Actinomadura violacea]MBO2462667.1 hypothetical protein [Actinomadura violacea]
MPTTDPDDPVNDPEVRGLAAALHSVIDYAAQAAESAADADPGKLDVTGDYLAALDELNASLKLRVPEEAQDAALRFQATVSTGSQSPIPRRRRRAGRGRRRRRRPNGMTTSQGGSSLPHHEELLRRYLRLFQGCHVAAGRRYGSLFDLILEQGQWNRPALFPEQSAHLRGRPGRCFDNAARLARLTGLRYTEAFTLPDVALVPLPHAWCITDDGTVVDPTWPTPGLAYLSVSLTLAYRAAVLQRRVPGPGGRAPAVFDDADRALLYDGIPPDALALPGESEPAGCGGGGGRRACGLPRRSGLVPQ